METRDAIEDVVYSMSVHERLEHLVSGFLGMHDKQHIPIDIIELCVDYSGISQYNLYELVKSKTELKQESEKRKQRKKVIDKAGYLYNEMKVVMMGANGVGKSQILIRFVTGQFVEEYDPTIEDGYRKQTVVDDIPFIWDVLDPYPQPEFQSLHDEWIRVGEYFLFVYDITNRDSFEQIPSMIQQVKHIKANQEEWFGVIVGNKCDLEQERAISRKEAEKLTDKYDNLIFMETSPKDDINCVQVFHACAEWYLKNKLIPDYAKHNEANGFNNPNSACCTLL